MRADAKDKAKSRKIADLERLAGNPNLAISEPATAKLLELIQGDA